MTAKETKAAREELWSKIKHVEKRRETLLRHGAPQIILDNEDRIIAKYRRELWSSVYAPRR